MTTLGLCAPPKSACPPPTALKSVTHFPLIYLQDSGIKGSSVGLTDSETVVSPERVSCGVELHNYTDIFRSFWVEDHLGPCLALLSPYSGDGCAIASVSITGDLGGVKRCFKAS